MLKAHEPQLDRLVALKIVRPELAGDAAAMARFRREARAAAALRHPNVVTIYAVGEERGVQYIAMEYIGGLTLAQRIRRAGPLAADLARELFGQLLSGLAAAHAGGLIHRDIKSSNILLGEAPEAGRPRAVECAAASDPPSTNLGPDACPPAGPPLLKIADFGLARLLTAPAHATVTAGLIGTPEYMSPEQTSGAEQLDHRADLYSAGVVLFEMLTGQTPFRGHTPTALIQQILNQAPIHPRKLNPDADPVLASLALRLMAKRPEDRLPSAHAALEALSGGRPVKCRKPRRRLGLVVAVLGGLLAIAGIAAGVSFLASAANEISNQAAAARPDAGGASGSSAAAVDAREVNEITNVRIDRDTWREVQVRYGRDTRWRTFCRFPGPNGDALVTRVLRLEQGSAGGPCVIAGLNAPDQPANVVALAASGAVVWQRQICDEPGLVWPDCEPPTVWSCTALAAGPLDNTAGDELVVAVGEREYPAVLAILDAASGALRATFHHLGHLNHVGVVPGIGAPDQSAIVAVGINNKLDGFAKPNISSDPPLTVFDLVPVLMILDPSDLDNGVGPPVLADSRYRPMGGVRAYGFLDVPWYKDEPAPTAEPDCGQVKIAPGALRTPADEHEWCIEVEVLCETSAYNATLGFNSSLQLVSIKNDKNPGGQIYKFWSSRWHRIVPANQSAP